MLQSLRTPFFTVVCTLLFIYVFAKLFGPLPISVNSVVTNKQDLFTVNGEGEAAAIPDTATLSLGVTKTASTVAAAQKAANEVAEKVIADLKDLGIDEKKIKTTNYTVNPDYDFTSGRQSIRSYTVTQNISAEISPIEKANDALDKATADGANLIGGITFPLADEKKKELEESARKQAIESAKEKAESIAKIAGIRLGRLINVQESSGYQPPILYDRELQAVPAEDTVPKTDLQPGENTIKITVTLSYETL